MMSIVSVSLLLLILIRSAILMLLTRLSEQFEHFARLPIDEFGGLRAFTLHATLVERLKFLIAFERKMAYEIVLSFRTVRCAFIFSRKFSECMLPFFLQNDVDTRPSRHVSLIIIIIIIGRG
jgi:hypothetical protein